MPQEQIIHIVKRPPISKLEIKTASGQRIFIVDLGEKEKIPCPFYRARGFKEELCYCCIPQTRREFMDTSKTDCFKDGACLPNDTMPEKSGEERRAWARKEYSRK